MFPRDAGNPDAFVPQRASGLLAVGLSLGLHGAALAGLLVFSWTTPPKPHEVIAVELVNAVETTGPPGKSAGERQGSSPGPNEASSAATETAAISEARRDLALTHSDVPDASDSPVIEPALDSIRDGPSPITPERTSLLRDRGPNTNRDPSPVSETALAPVEPTEVAPLLPPEPRRKPPAPDPATDPSLAERRIEAELARLKDTSPRLADQGSLRDAARSANDPSAPNGPKTAGFEERKNRGEAALPVNLPVGDSDGQPGGSAGKAPRYAGRGLANAPPRYPYLARRRGQEGRAVLRVSVTVDGEAAAVRLQESSGFRLLDEAAIEAIKDWRFIPAERGGIPIAGYVDVPVSFKLTD